VHINDQFSSEIGSRPMGSMKIIQKQRIRNYI